MVDAASLRSRSAANSNVARVFTGQRREVPQNLLFRHPSSQIFQDVVHRDTGAAYAGFPTADGGVNYNTVLVIHAMILLLDGSQLKTDDELPNGHRIVTILPPSIIFMTEEHK